MFEIFSCPFHVDVNSVPENLQMELIELQCNNEMKQIFASSSKNNFYNTYITSERYYNLRYFAQRVVSAFGSTCVCETFFSKMEFTKSSSRASLTDGNLENQLRCAMSNINIDLQKLSERKDKQISHQLRLESSLYFNHSITIKFYSFCSCIIFFKSMFT